MPTIYAAKVAHITVAVYLRGAPFCLRTCRTLATGLRFVGPINVRSMSLPASQSLIDATSRRAFSGLDIKYPVVVETSARHLASISALYLTF
jgi:hypothetical protein